MYDHHRRVIARLADQFRDDARFPALIIGGSLVRGWGRPDSDIDVIFVATDAEHARRAPQWDLHYHDSDICDYDGGYIDGKIVDMAFLREVAEKGIEPIRAAFVNAYTAYSHLPEVDELIQRIPVYPEADRAAKIESFYSQVLLLNWFIGEAAKRDNIYLMTRSVADLVLFGGRLILAHNRILYPYHKWLIQALEEAPDKPAGFMALTDKLLAQPDIDTARAYVECLQGFQDWGVDYEAAIVHFMRDREWHWRYGPPPIHDW